MRAFSLRCVIGLVIVASLCCVSNAQQNGAVDFGSFTLGGTSSSYYPIQFASGIYGASPGAPGANTSDLVIYRNDTHENGTWFGTFNFVVSFHPSDWGHFVGELEKLVYQTGSGSPYNDPVGDLTDGSATGAGNDLIVWLKGGATYHWRNKESTGSWSLANANSAAGSITDSSGIVHNPITSQSALILGAKNRLYINAVGFGTAGNIDIGGDVNAGGSGITRCIVPLFGTGEEGAALFDGSNNNWVKLGKGLYDGLQTMCNVATPTNTTRKYFLVTRYSDSTSVGQAVDIRFELPASMNGTSSTAYGHGYTLSRIWGWSDDMGRMDWTEIPPTAITGAPGAVFPYYWQVDARKTPGSNGSTNIYAMWLVGVDVRGAGNASYSQADTTAISGVAVYRLGGVTKPFYENNGNVGIGTATPTQRLEVSGNAKLDGSLLFNDGTAQTTAWTGALCGGDYAESVAVSGERVLYEPGDVLVIDPSNSQNFVKSSTSYATTVAGIYSTKPGVVGKRSTNPNSARSEIPMAMVGIVPTKVTTENGPIKIGDLLVTSSVPGYAMKGTDRPQMLGAVVGKAIEPLNAGRGVINVLVTLQ